MPIIRFLYNGQLGVATDDNGLYYMRNRYYNPYIKRFINQDILTGSIGNSASLNRYSYVEGNPVSYTDPFGLSPYGNFGTFLAVMKFMSQLDIMSIVHVTLNVLGALPGCTWLNFINAGLYLAEQNYAEACKSLLFGLANLDWLTGAAKFAVSIGKYTEDLGLILKGIDLGLHLLACCQSATDFGTIAAGMIDKYLVNGEDVTWKIALEFLMLTGTGLQLGLLTHSLTGKLSTTFGGSSLDGGGVSAVTKNKHVQEVVDDASSSDTKLRMPSGNGNGNSSSSSKGNGKQYSVMYEANSGNGKSRSAHRNAANREFYNKMANDPEFKKSVDDYFGYDVMKYMETGKNSLRNPSPDWVWHHSAETPDTIQLIPKSQHQASEFQSILHPGPNGEGGFGLYY